MYNNRNYIIFNVSEVDKVDFNQVLETSAETLRKSVDGTKTFIKWDSSVLAAIHTAPADDPAAAGDPGYVIQVEPGVPSFLDDLTTKEGPYTHEEMLTILATEEWTSPLSPEA
jgi:hypothetical protein